MAFDTLQRWHETHHVDAGAYHINLPPIRPGIPKYSAWPAISQALQHLLPELDPLQIAKRRLAMAQLPLEQAKTKLALQYGIPAQEAQYKAMMRAYQSGGINPATGKPWTQQDLLRQQKLREKQDMDSRYHRYDFWNTKDATTSADQPPPNEGYVGGDNADQVNPSGFVPDLSGMEDEGTQVA
jgi:hypothetical protein